MSEAIEVKNLEFSYGSTPVLKDVSFLVREGSFSVLLGQNGAGKSTLLRLLLGELDPEDGKGEIHLLGCDLRRFKDWPSVSYVPQDGMAAYKSFPASVEEVVTAALYSRIGLFRFPGKRERERTRAALALAGMEGYEKRLIGALSGGQRQRVLLARALVNEPRLMILDEPTTGMDEQSTEEFYRLLGRINRENGVTIFMITHDRHRWEEYADQVLVLEEGRIEGRREEREKDGDI